MRRARWKRKSVCSKLAHRCKFGGNGFCENCCAGEELRTKSRAGCRACPALYAVLIVASNLRVQIGHPLLLFPLPLPIPKRGFQRRGPSPSPKKGFQRGGPQPAPLCRFKGVRGEIEIPPRFSLGGRGGHSLFKREYPLWLLASETGAALCAKDPFPLPRHGNVPLREQVLPRAA